jgi:hypothetical protein
VNGVATGTMAAGWRTRRWQDGRVTTYLASVVLGVALLLVFVRVVFLNWRW